MNAKDYLKQLKKLDRMIENKRIELAQWRSMACNVSSQWGGERVQSTSNPHKMSDAVDNYIDLEKEIDICIFAMIQTKKEIISTIEMLNPAQYDLLHKLYVQGLTFDEAAFACDKSRSWATTIHGRALKNVQRILDERENA